MKLFIKLLAGVISLLILSVVILLTVIDPNDYKQEIQDQVKKAINRELLIKGDINWTIYPQLGLSSGEIALNNPESFNREHLLKIENTAIGLQLLPLFVGEIKIGKLTLNGLRFNLITNKDGLSNLDNMTSNTASTESKPQATTTTTETQQPGFFAIDKTELAGINIENAVFEMQDLQVGSTSKVDIKHIKLAKFALGQETDISIITDLLIAKMNGHIELQSKLLVAPDFSSIQLNQLDLQTQLTGADLPNGKITAAVKSDIHYDLNSKKAQLDKLFLALDKINLTGKVAVQTNKITKVRFTLQGNEWDLNPYLPPPPEKQQDTNTASASASEATKASGTANQPPVAEQEPDLSFLHDLNVDGSLSIAGVKVSGLTIGKVDTKLVVKNGKAQIKPLTAQLYQGLVTVSGWVDDANGLNRYKLSSKVDKVQIRPLLQDAAETDLLSGSSELNFYAIGEGLTASKIKSGLVGNGDFKLTDGALYGINISQELRLLKAQLKGKKAPTDANIKKTDFASLTGEFNISQGVIDNNKFLMLSPVMRLDGLGLINILKESLDYKLTITPLKGDLDEITIPLLIKGPFTSPQFSLDMNDVLQQQIKLQRKKLEQKAKAELKRQQRKLQEKSQKEIQDKLKKELGRLFN